MMYPSVRPAVSTDYATLVSWIPDARACAQWAGPHLRFPFSPRELSEVIKVRGAKDFSLVDAEGSLLGFGQTWPRDDGAVHLGRVIVSPGERGHALGFVLGSALVAEAQRDSRTGRVTLRVYRDNPAAISVYAKLGFKTVEAESNAETWAMELVGPGGAR